MSQLQELLAERVLQPAVVEGVVEASDDQANQGADSSDDGAVDPVASPLRDVLSVGGVTESIGRVERILRVVEVVGRTLAIEQALGAVADNLAEVLIGLLLLADEDDGLVLGVGLGGAFLSGGDCGAASNDGQSGCGSNCSGCLLYTSPSPRD